jgi:hypothetical protein
MKQQWSGLFAAAMIAAAVTVSAQVQSPSPATTPPADANVRPGTQKSTPEPSAQGRVPNTTVVTGCLQSAPVATAAVVGRTTATPGYVLANPQMTAEGDATPRAVGTTGATTVTSYRLDGDEKMMSPHVNHQVRIKGSLQTAAASTGAAGASAGANVAATLKVESVEMIAEACTPAAGSDTPRAQPAQPGPAGQPAPPPAEPVRPEAPSTPPEKQ